MATCTQRIGLAWRKRLHHRRHHHRLSLTNASFAWPAPLDRAVRGQFFREHAAFAGVSGATFGVASLTTRLSDLLVRRIGAALPSMKWEMQSQLGQVSGASSSNPGYDGAALV
jgi:hypothetical protein